MSNPDTNLAGAQLLLETMYPAEFAERLLILFQVMAGHPEVRHRVTDDYNKANSSDPNRGSWIYLDPFAVAMGQIAFYPDYQTTVKESDDLRRGQWDQVSSRLMTTARRLYFER